jgi:sugar-specific transcriptional regulator TrmB
MKKEDILRTLSGCGLNEYESRTYSSLVFLGMAKASTISKESNVPQSKIYDVLEGLMRKQMVEVFDGRPKEFKAVEPEVALNRLLEERDREISTLKFRVDEISNFLKPLASEETVDGVWTVKGRKWVEFFDKVVEMADRSEKYVYGVTRDYSRSSRLAEAIKKCVKRGVDVRVIGLEDVTGDNYYKAKWYHEQGAKLRVFATKVHPRIAVIDGKEVLLRLDYDPSKRSNFKFSSLWSADPALVKVFDIYVKNLWKNSKPVSFRKSF